ncbi:hypothetical protein [Bartonella sp. CB189]|uniref:hypothetical protein n=1 Tax=Bartonella sp. CB189 TaxID=3112254 RepID=UPI002F96A3FB
MGFLGRRGVFILVIFLLFGANFLFSGSKTVHKFIRSNIFPSYQADVGSSSHQDMVFTDSAEHVILERLAVSFPDIMENISKMNPQQKKQLIELVRRDAIASAVANGHSEAAARKYGEAVAMVLSKIAFNSSIGDDYF